MLERHRETEPLPAPPGSPPAQRRQIPPEDASVVGAIAGSVRREAGLARLAAVGGPSGTPRIAAVHEFVELCRRLVFVGFFDRHEVCENESTLWGHVAGLVERVRAVLEEQVARALAMGDAPQNARATEAARIAREFLEGVPALRAALALDVRATYEGDPAARSIDEIILCYPGIDAVFAHRIAHALHRLGVPLIPRIIGELAHSRTGIDIHPGATIGRAFFIDHGTGVTIGETAVIGDHVKIYQGVTLGARSFPRDPEGKIVRGEKRHPTIGSRVTIYADAVILGGDTVVGDDCVISGAVFLTQSVPPGHLVRAKQPELVMRTNPELRRMGE